MDRGMVRRLSQALRGVEGLVLAYLYGSALRAGRPRDVDIAVLIRGVGKLEAISQIVERVSKALQISEERVDVLDLERADPLLIHRILSEGVKLLDVGDEEERLSSRLQAIYPTLREELRCSRELWLREDPEVDEELLSRRLDEVLRDVALLERYLEEGLEWILGDLERTYAFERAIHRAIEAALDICRHLVHALGLGAVEYYSQYPRRLGEAGVMPQKLAEELSEMARVRNILVHRYVELNHELLYEAAERLRDLAPRLSEWLRENLRRRGFRGRGRPS